MGTIRSTAALIGWLELGMLALGALSQPLRNGMAPRTTPAPDTTVVPLPVKTPVATAAVSLDRASRDWSVEIDEATLTQNLNGWARAQPPVQTPLGMARLEDLTVELRDDQVVLKGTAQAAWVRAGRLVGERLCTEWACTDPIAGGTRQWGSGARGHAPPTRATVAGPA